MYLTYKRRSLKHPLLLRRVGSVRVGERRGRGSRGRGKAFVANELLQGFDVVLEEIDIAWELLSFTKKDTLNGMMPKFLSMKGEVLWGRSFG